MSMVPSLLLLANMTSTSEWYNQTNLTLIPFLLSFMFVPRLRIQHLLDHTTRFPRLDTRLLLRKYFKSRFPAANVNRLNEVVATDTYLSDTPALDDGIMGHGGY